MKVFGQCPPKRLFRASLRLTTMFVVLCFVSCNKPKNEEPPISGYLIDAVSAGKMTAEEIRTQMTGQYANLKPFVQTGFETYKVRYKTRFKNEEITVSGLFVIPTELSSSTPVMVYNHGTIGTGNPPSQSTVSDLSSEAAIAYITSSIFRCTTILPDYIGYGSSKSVVHPYVHAESLGRTGLDLIRAYMEYSEKTPNLPPANRNLVIVGYSEGGYASVALHKTIQETAPDLKIVKTYAGAGPYDIEYFINKVSETDNELAPVHLSSYLWVLSTYLSFMANPIPFNTIFSEADNAVLAAANYNLGYLKEHNINRNPRKLFTKSFLDMIADGSNTEITNIIKQNTLTNFVPSDSLILFHSEADSWVYVQNTKNAYDKMRSKNAPVRSIIVPRDRNMDHGDAVPIFIQSTFLNLILTVFLR